MQFPLHLEFKFSLWNKIQIKDDNQKSLMFIKQKMFKLKEKINVFSDDTETNLMYSIEADRIIDFSASYHFTDANGGIIGYIKRKGFKSIWKAEYMIFDSNNQEIFKIKEKNPWIKILDAFFCEIPVLSFFSGFVFNPTYQVVDNAGVVQLTLSKKPSFLSRLFTLNETQDIPENKEPLVILSCIMALLIENTRG